MTKMVFDFFTVKRATLHLRNVDVARHLASQLHLGALENEELTVQINEGMINAPNSNFFVRTIHDEGDVTRNQYLCIHCKLQVGGIRDVVRHYEF